MNGERPLRILHLTAGSDAGGLSRYVHDLGSAMIERGHDVAVAGERGAWHGLFEQSNLRWVDVPLKGNPLKLWSARRRLQAYLREHPADVLHVHYRRPMLVARGLQERLAERVPVLYTVHLTDLKMSFPWSLLTDFGDWVHVASADARRWVEEAGGVKPERIAVIPHGVDVAKYPVTSEEARRVVRERFGIAAGARVGAFVGRLDVPKNEEWIIDLAGRAKEGVFLLAGEGPHEGRVRERVRAEGLEARVKVLGHVDPLGVYQAADVLLLPSEREGFSLACAEAMSCGVPVLRTRTAGTTETVVEGVTGRSMEINREAFLRAAEEMMTMDAGKLRGMGEAAAKHVRERLTFERQYDATVELYRRISGRGVA